MTHTSPSSSSRPNAYAPEAWLLTAILWTSFAIAALLLINLATLPLGRDQAVFSLIGAGMLEGRAAYSEAWDIKPPAIYVVFSIAHGIFGDSELAPRLFEAVAMLAMALGFYRLSESVDATHAAALAFAITLFAMVKLGFWHTSQPETYAAVLLVWAVVGTQRHWYVTVGAIYFFAALLKPSFGGGIIPSMLYAIMMIPRDRRGLISIVQVLMRFAVGGAAVTSLFGVYLWLSGGLAEFIWTTFSFMPNYLGDVSSETSTSLFYEFAKTIWYMLLSWPVIIIGCCLGLLFCLTRSELRATAFLLIGVAFFPMVGVALQGKYFPYHFVAAIGPLGLLAGWGFWFALSSERLILLLRVAVLFLLIGLMIVPETSQRFFRNTTDRVQTALLPASERETHGRDVFSWRSFDRESMLKTADWIKTNTPESTSIYVWGFDPNIYLMSERPHSSRFISNFTQRVEWSAEATRQELLVTLEQTPPTVIVVSKFDVMEAVTGNNMSSGDVLETDFVELRTFIQENYILAKDFGSFDVYRLDAETN